MFSTKVTLLPTSIYPEEICPVVFNGRQIQRIESSSKIEELRGRIASVELPEYNLLIFYSVTSKPHALRFVRVRDVLPEGHYDDILAWADILKEPVDNIKTVLEFLSL